MNDSIAEYLNGTFADNDYVQSISNLSGTFADNTSVQSIFNLTDNQNVTAKAEGHSATLWAVAIYLTCVACCAIGGNITVLTIILRDPKLRSKPHNHLLICLAICDLSVLFGGYPFTIISAYSGKWMFGDGLCVWAGFFTFFVSLAAENIIVAICVYRYVLICMPGKSFMLTPKLTQYVILACFAYSFFWTGPPLVGWGTYGLEPFLVSCSLDWVKKDLASISYLVGTIIFCYFLHIGIMANCYKHISRTVAQLAKRDMERGRIVREDEMLYRSKIADDQQVTRMCFLVVIVFATVWAPYTFVCAVHIFYEDMPFYLTTFPTMFAKSGCMMNPLVYFMTNPNFRSKAMEFIGCGRIDNVVGIARSNGEVVRTYDKLSKDGVYLGQEKVQMERSSTMF